MVNLLPGEIVIWGHVLLVAIIWEVVNIGLARWNGDKFGDFLLKNLGMVLCIGFISFILTEAAPLIARDLIPLTIEEIIIAEFIGMAKVLAGLVGIVLAIALLLALKWVLWKTLIDKK